MREPADASEAPARRDRRSPAHPPRGRDVTRAASCGPPRRPRLAGLRNAASRFRRRQRGSVAIESALGITVLVVSLAVVMEITSAAYESDRMSRAARAAARSVALNPQAGPAQAGTIACSSIIRELALPTGFVCNAEWKIDINAGLLPADLPKTLDPNLGTVAGTGDMVFVRIGWYRDAFTPGKPAVPMLSIGLARSEP